MYGLIGKLTISLIYFFVKQYFEVLSEHENIHADGDTRGILKGWIKDLSESGLKVSSVCFEILDSCPPHESFHSCNFSELQCALVLRFRRRKETKSDYDASFFIWNTKLRRIIEYSSGRNNWDNRKKGWKIIMTNTGDIFSIQKILNLIFNR